MSEKELNNYRPDNVSAPGETLADLLDERAMTQAELAERTGRPLKTINEIVKGKTAITPETAIQFERVLGTPAEFWNQREANYRAFLARKKEAESLATNKGWLKQFPLKEMIKRGWVQDCGNDYTMQTICILNFFGVASPEQWETGWTQRRLAFRKSMNVNSDLGATATWLRQGEIEGEKVSCKPFDREKLVKALDQIRALTKEKDPKVFIPELQNICADCGVAVVFVEPFPKVPVYGASCWLNPEKALIQLSNRGKYADTLWFTVFHELCHVLQHSKKEIFVEIEGKDQHKSPEEQEADQFASEKLIPSKDMEQWLATQPSLVARSVTDFANRIGVAPGIVVGRLFHLRRIHYSSPLRSLRFKYEW